MNAGNYEHINMETINEMADGEDDFIVSIISVYLTSIPESMAKLREASATKNTDDIIFYVHKLKGSFNFIGCTELTDIFLKIEDDCAVGKCNEDMQKLIATVDDLTDKVTLELKDVLARIEAK